MNQSQVVCIRMLTMQLVDEIKLLGFIFLFVCLINFVFFIIKRNKCKRQQQLATYC